MDGNIFAVHIVPKFISRDDFKVFLRKLRDHFEGRYTHIVLDNLNMHKNKEVRALARRYRQELVFNAIYSSEFNPIEFAWGWAKKKFASEFITLQDNEYRTLRTVIRRIVKSVPRQLLAKRSLTCFNGMRNY